MAASRDAPLDLVIRFSTSNPDIVLSIDRPSTTTCLSLKQQIRSRLDKPASESKLRLIHAGKVLQDNAALSQSLNITLPPPSTTQDEAKSEKAKGKQPIRDKPPPSARVYIHCSIGDTLTQSELSSEARAAEEANEALITKTLPTLTHPTGQNNSPTTTTPAPRGFDRLLTAGFTPTEITTLRTQFLAIQSHTHTPDTMPSGAELLALEERWLDNGAQAGSAGAEDTGGFGGEDAAAEPTNSFDFSEALNDPFLNMTTVYRNAAAVAEERVLELTQQWENTLRSMKPSEITGAIFASSSTSTTKGNKEEKYPYPESAQAESGGDGKRSG